MEELKYKVPNRRMAEKILEEASILNHDPWVEHSRYVAETAALIA